MPEFPSATSEKLDVARYACVFLLCRMKIHSALLVQLIFVCCTGISLQTDIRSKCFFCMNPAFSVAAEIAIFPIRRHRCRMRIRMIFRRHRKSAPRRTDLYHHIKCFPFRKRYCLFQIHCIIACLLNTPGLQQRSFLPAI